MKSSFLALLLLTLSLAYSFENQDDNLVVRGDTICTSEEEGEYCYPKVFIPSKDWQDILPGQTIPGGLHVRINVQTGLKEAKLVDPNDGSDVNAVQIVHDHQKDTPSEKSYEEYLDVGDIETLDEEEGEDDQDLREKIRLSSNSGHVAQLLDSLDKLSQYQKLNKREFVQALETLSDLGHELDYGARIAGGGSKQLISIIQSSAVTDDLKEIAARALGASLRNNPSAIEKVSDLNVVKSLLEAVENSKDDTLTGRLVYAVGSIVSNGEGDMSIYKRHDDEFLESHGGEIFRRVFNEGGPDLKKKVSTFVYDRALRLVWPDSELVDWSDTFQNTLTHSNLDRSTKLRVFQALTELHEYMGESEGISQGPNHIMKRGTAEMLPVRDDFLDWLSKQADSYRGKTNVDDEEEVEFQQLVLRARHAVYGNPLAGRKVF